MLFNSIEFLVFLPIVFVLYWFVFQKREWQNLLIVTASYGGNLLRRGKRGWCAL